MTNILILHITNLSREITYNIKTTREYRVIFNMPERMQHFLYQFDSTNNGISESELLLKHKITNHIYNASADNPFYPCLSNYGIRLKLRNYLYG